MTVLAHAVPLTKEPHIGLRAHNSQRKRDKCTLYLSFASSLFVSVVMSEEGLGRHLTERVRDRDRDRDRVRDRDRETETDRQTDRQTET